MVLPWFYHDLPWFCYGFTKIYHGFTMVLSWFCYGFSGICHGFVMVVWNLLMFCHLPHREPFQMKVAIVFVSKLGLPRRELFQVWGSNIRCCQNWACPAVSPSKYEVAILLVPKLGLPHHEPPSRHEVPIVAVSKLGLPKLGVPQRKLQDCHLIMKHWACRACQIIKLKLVPFGYFKDINIFWSTSTLRFRCRNFRQWIKVRMVTVYSSILQVVTSPKFTSYGPTWKNSGSPTIKGCVRLRVGPTRVTPQETTTLAYKRRAFSLRIGKRRHQLESGKKTKND